MVLHDVIGLRSPFAKFVLAFAICTGAFAVNIVGLWQANDVPDGSQISLRFAEQSDDGKVAGYMLFPGKRGELQGSFDENDENKVTFTVILQSDDGTRQARKFRGEIKDNELPLEEFIDDVWQPYHTFYRM